jgi:exodeoxyribonuclease VII small subunit
MAKRKQPDADGELSFEQALQQLETIVESMENEALPLEDLVAGYEKGSSLLARCDALLNSAHERIKLVTLKLADAGAEADADVGPEDEPETDDDVRLF